MENKENRFFWFEHEMRKESSDSAVDFSAVEFKLFKRISEVEKLGELSVLKMDEIVSLEKFDHLRKKLFSSITQFKEYEEPVNDCIKVEQKPDYIRWDLMESKLESKIHEISFIPEWEQILLSPEQEFLPGYWEKIEKTLFTKINNIELVGFWESVLKEEKIQVPVQVENLEKCLDNKLEKVSKLERVDQILLRDQILPPGKWEKIEENLLKAIETENKYLSLEKQPFWYIIRNYSSLFKKGSMVIAGLIIAFIGLNGFRINSFQDKPIPTIVYQLQGGMANQNNSDKIVNGKYSSVDNSAVTLVNDHGVIELTDRSDLYLSNITKNRAHYKVEFGKNSNKNGGKASFIVKPRRKKQDFRVFTPDYQVVVKGTYFRVEPDKMGKVSTKVLEGVVKIESAVFGDTVLRAGQYISYDSVSSRYKISDGGSVVQRKEIKKVPSVDELLKFQVLRIFSNVPDAQIKINGRFVGYSPLIVRRPTGIHNISITKNGFSTIDTTVNITLNEPVEILELVLEKNENLEYAGKFKTENRIKYKKRNSVSKQKNLEADNKDNKSRIVPETITKSLLEELPESDETEGLYLKAQNYEKSGKWEKAIKLYEQIFNNQTVSRLRREDALFSIGRLKAENETDFIGAQKVFFKYLAIFPDGSYSGESWLRLAELEFLNSPEKAIQYYLKYFEKFPRHPRISELQNRVGAIYLQQKKYDQSIDMFRKALYNLDPSKKEEQRYISSNLHKALQEKGDIRRAEEVWKQYLANAPEK